VNKFRYELTNIVFPTAYTNFHKPHKNEHHRSIHQCRIFYITAMMPIYSHKNKQNVSMMIITIFFRPVVQIIVFVRNTLQANTLVRLGTCFT